MREIVKCLNCGIIWQRVTAFGVISELNDDLMYNCPKCGSNWYETYNPEAQLAHDKVAQLSPHNTYRSVV